MIYSLPTVRSNREGFDSLGELVKATEHLFADRLQLDMSKAYFVDANMAAPLGAILARVADALNTVEIVDLHPPVERALSQTSSLRTIGTTQSMTPTTRRCLFDGCD